MRDRIKIKKNESINVDYFEEALNDEESGDRWLGSDITKALRFYQKSYVNYIKSLSKTLDTKEIKYNIARLIYHVYTTYIETEVLEDITIDELDVANPVTQNLQDIGKIHQDTLRNSDFEVDLWYNTGLVYTDILELEDLSLENALELSNQSMELFRSLIDEEIKQLKLFINDLSNINDTPETVENTEQEATSEIVLQPNDVFDTVLSGYKLVHAILSNASVSNKDQFQQLISPFFQYLDTIATELINNFNESNNAQSEYLSSINNGQIIEYQIFKNYINALTCHDVESVINVWSDETLPKEPERYMSACDTIQAIIDRINPEPAQLWLGLTAMTQNLKLAQDQLMIRKKNVSEGIGKINEMIANIFIQRSDIDIQRAKLDLPQAISSQSVLLNNAKVFLKSAMNIANSLGGLREKSLEKAERYKRKLEAVARMCLLENKTEPEMMEIMGPVYKREITKVLKLDYYN